MIESGRLILFLTLTQSSLCSDPVKSGEADELNAGMQRCSACPLESVRSLTEPELRGTASTKLKLKNVSLIYVRSFMNNFTCWGCLFLFLNNYF